MKIIYQLIKDANSSYAELDDMPFFYVKTDDNTYRDNTYRQW